MTGPAEYRFCGYGEAIGGGESARDDLRSLLLRKSNSWKAVQAEYRRLLYSSEEESSIRKGFTREQSSEVEAQQGHLPAGAALRHRSLSEGIILGSRAFIDGWRDRNRWRFGERTVSRSPERRLPDLAALGVFPPAPA
ncbi:MAG: hypothetical protein IT186_10220 [Acidobacteria bacterium]|nr:hypothetical protein [Acidobacteriota bacterium]